jgi:hypothetical protein
LLCFKSRIKHIDAYISLYNEIFDRRLADFPEEPLQEYFLIPEIQRQFYSIEVHLHMEIRDISVQIDILNIAWEEIWMETSASFFKICSEKKRNFGLWL